MLQNYHNNWNTSEMKLMLNLLKIKITIKVTLFVNTLITAYRVKQTITKGGLRFFKQVAQKLTSFTFYGMPC